MTASSHIPSDLPSASTPRQSLDLRQTKCPLNFVKTKLALEKMASGDILEIWIEDQGESSINIPNSIQQEGHTIIKCVSNPETQAQCIWILKNA